VSETASVAADGYILLDTNTVWKDFYLKKQIFSDLKYHAENYNLKILVPSIVRDEVFANFEKQWDEAALQFTNTFIYHADSLNLADEKQKALDQLNSAWNDFLENEVAELLDCSELNMRDLISRSIKGLRPFQASSDKGFKDTLIWMSVIEHLKKVGVGTQLIVITNNKSDFTEDNRNLASNLILELEEIHVSGLYFKEIGQYLDNESKKDESIVTLRKSLVTSMPDLIQGHFDLYDYYQESIEEWVYDYTDIHERALSSINIENPAVKFIEIRKLRSGKQPGDQKDIISGEVVVELRATCNYVIDADYDGTVSEEINIKFVGFIPFTMLKESGTSEKYKMPELGNFILAQVETIDPEDNAFTVTYITN
jgi:hypothetical protein